MPSNLHLVTRDDDQRGIDHSAGDGDQGALPADFPPGWDDYAAARRRFLKRVAKRRAERDEGEPLEDGEEESWL